MISLSRRSYTKTVVPELAYSSRRPPAGSRVAPCVVVLQKTHKILKVKEWALSEVDGQASLFVVSVASSLTEYDFASTSTLCGCGRLLL